MTLIIRARLTAYRYRGPHRNFDLTRGRVAPGHKHWDWRYVIRVNGERVVYRQGFCTWERALTSLDKTMRRIRRALEQAGA